MTRHVLIIGGGYAGMAAAVTLADAGQRVTVLEAARTLGGRARRVEINGETLDNGQHLLIGAYRTTLRLIEQVRPAGDPAPLLRLPLTLSSPDGFHLSCPAWPAPLHLAVGLLRARGLSLGDKLAAARFMAIARRVKYRLVRDLPLAELLRDCAQPDNLIRRLWEPLCIAALNTPLAQASSQVFYHVLRDSLDGSRQDSEFLVPRVDLSALFPEPAAAYVQARGGTVLTGQTVTAVQSASGGFTVSTAHQQHGADAVIVATAPHRVFTALAETPGLADLLQQIRGLTYQPIITVYLHYPATTRLPLPLLALNGGLGQWVFDRGQLGGAAGSLAVVISAEGQHLDLSHDDLASAVAAELVRALGLPAPLAQQVIAEKRATFAALPNLSRPPVATALPRLYLAGDYTAGDYPATLEGATRSGVESAEAALAELGALKAQ